MNLNYQRFVTYTDSYGSRTETWRFKALNFKQQ